MGRPAMRRGLRPLLLLLGGALALTGCGYFRQEVKPYRPPISYGAPDTSPGALLAHPGAHLYLRDCAYCHGGDGRGTSRGPDLTEGTNGGALTDFVLRTGRMPVDGPVAQMKPGPPVYDEGEIAAIVSYVTTEFRPPGPNIYHVDLRRGSLRSASRSTSSTARPAMRRRGSGAPCSSTPGKRRRARRGGS